MLMRLTDEHRDAFRREVLAAARREDVAEAARNVYAALQDAIELRGPRCDASGRCCRFEAFDHSLFVTTLELAAFCHELRGHETGRAVDALAAGWDGAGCLFQRGGLCGVRSIRPLGCRVFFCDPTSTDWQHRQSERFQRELKRLHEELSLAYFYVEWREALSAVGIRAGAG